MNKKHFIFNCVIIAGLFAFISTSIGMAGSPLDPTFNFAFIETNKISPQVKVFSDKNFAVSGVVNKIIVGRGFEPFEQVSLRLAQVGDFQNLRLTVGRWNVYADGEGGFVSNRTFAAVNDNFVLRAAGVNSKAEAQTYFNAILNASADLDQCRNGGLLSPVPCTGDAWVNGNLNGTQAHYLEGESVPYRLRFEDLDTSVSHTVVIEYDTTQSGKHALDYLTSFDRTEATASPCDGVVNCNPALFDTEAIPMDESVMKGEDGVMGTADDITPVSGDFTLFNGTITNISAYTLSGTYAGNSQTKISITFTASEPNPVLAWGGHISTRMDWGLNHSAIAISGAPYHMRLLDLDGSGGNQDRGLAADAAIFPAWLTIVKQTMPANSEIDFAFTTTGLSAASFMLDTDTADGTLSNQKAFQDLTSFGMMNPKTVTEAVTVGWRLTNIVCVETAGGGASSSNSTVNLTNRQATIIAEEGELITCTFTNALLLAANASIGGRVTNEFGTGIRGAIVTVTNVSTDETIYALTNSFGYYNFTDLPVGTSYMLTVRAKRYTFKLDTRLITLNEDLGNIDFTASPILSRGFAPR